MMLVVFKSAPILKRALKVKQAMMQLYVLKLLKIQTKYLGRQWRKSNMKTMSAIYQKVRHRMNDDWAYGNDVDARPWDFQAEECSLRAHIESFNSRRVTMFKACQPCCLLIHTRKARCLATLPLPHGNQSNCGTNGSLRAPPLGDEPRPPRASVAAVAAEGRRRRVSSRARGNEDRGVVGTPDSCCVWNPIRWCFFESGHDAHPLT
ncbi:striatin-interacting protein 2-like [Crotalus adamanteus]|uniref:Striatin-interacting protein 2-like n=1 Tax=Crotalus adamanteus TaxID=8729 RepID=A0AAW1BE60_CROAD